MTPRYGTCYAHTLKNTLNNKKGILFTIMLLLIATLVFSLSLSIKSTMETGGERFNRLATHNRVYDLSTSVGKSVKDLFIDSGIIVSSSGTQVIFNEQIPNNNLNNFFDRLNSLKEFVEQDQNILINTESINPILSLSIKPHSINYTHDYSQDKTINVIFSQTLPTNSELSIELLDNNVTGCSWDSNGGEFSLSVSVIGQNAVSCIQAASLDEDYDNTLTINNGDYLIRLNSVGLFITNNLFEEETINSQITLTLEQGPEEISLGNNIINVNIAGMDISKSSGVKVS